MHIPNAMCHWIVTRIFSLKVDFEIVLDLVFQTLRKHFLKVNFSKCSVKNSTQMGGDPLSTFAQSVGVSWDVGLAVVKPGKSWANWDGGSSLFHGLNCASKLEKSF